MYHVKWIYYQSIKGVIICASRVNDTNLALLNVLYEIRCQVLYTLFTLPLQLLYTHLHAALAAVHIHRLKVNVFIHPLLRTDHLMTLNALE